MGRGGEERGNVDSGDEGGRAGLLFLCCLRLVVLTVLRALPRLWRTVLSSGR